MINAGDTAWVLASSALVLLMTPGLAFFYGGMVRKKNILSVLMQCMMIVCLIGVQWVVMGYSISFHPGSGFWGGLGWSGLNGVGLEPYADYSGTIPHQAFMIFQAMRFLRHYILRALPLHASHGLMTTTLAAK